MDKTWVLGETASLRVAEGDAVNMVTNPWTISWQLLRVCAHPCLCVPARSTSGTAEGGDLSRFRGSGGCANFLPNVVSLGSLSALAPRVPPHTWLLGASGSPLGIPPWRAVSIFSVMGSFPDRQEGGPPRISFAGLLPCLRALCGTHRHENNLSKGDDFAVIKEEWVSSVFWESCHDARLFPYHLFEFQLCSGV